MNQMRDRISRRRLLKSGTLVGATALMGCSSLGESEEKSEPDVGTRTPTKDSKVPDTDTSTPTETVQSDTTTSTEAPDSDAMLSWPEYGYDNQNSRAIASDLSFDSLTINWDKEFESKEQWIDVKTDKNSIYVVEPTNPCTIYALQTTDGNERWQSDFDSLNVYSMAIGDEFIYLEVSDSSSNQPGPFYLVALYKTDGSIAWEIKLNSNLNSHMSIRNNKIFVSRGEKFLQINNRSGKISSSFSVSRIKNFVLYDNYLYLDNGKIIFSYNVSGKKRWESKKVLEQGNSNIVYFQGRLYTNCVHCESDGAGSVYAIDTETGNVIWKQSTGTMLRAPVAVSESTIYVSLTRSRFGAIDDKGDQGETAWAKYVTQPTQIKKPIVIGNNLFMIWGPANTSKWDYIMNVHVNNEKAGRVKSQIELPTDDIQYLRPSNEHLIVAGKNKIYNIN